ncbi:MAG: hypothetical protein IJ698_00635 [Prevotella sp.]|nr:hypothetical protein [Prevotella sp.]
MIKWGLTFLLASLMVLSTSCGRRNPLEKYMLMREQEEAEMQRTYREYNEQYNYGTPEEELYEEEDEYDTKRSMGIYEREQEYLEYEHNKNNQMLFDR